MKRHPGVVLATVLLTHAAAAQLIQQGSKLVGTGAAGPAYQGYSVAVSADGSTAIIGGWADDSKIGAAWVYTLSGGVWAQQGSKLVGTGAVGAGRQGRAVAISADGSTAIVVGPYDDFNTGAAWVYTRSAGVWSQQGTKLVGTGAVGAAAQGWSVALSADGSTAIVGGVWDSSNAGASWVYTRSGGAWSQQGSKLVGTGAAGAAYQGYSVAIAGDGNTAVVGGVGDSSFVGAAWVFTRSSGVWSQQGSKLVGASGVGAAYQGYSVAVSADGNTAIVGGYGDHSDAGAAWLFTRSGGVWSQQGSKLVGTGAVGIAAQGWSVAISADGNTAIAGGPSDDSNTGAAWVYTRSGAVWTQLGDKLVGTGAVGEANQGAVAVSGDGTTAILGGSYDDSRTGAAWVFSVPNSCLAPSITAQPQSEDIQRDQPAILSVTAKGTTPLTYQWYQGSSGDTSTPVGDDASTFTTPPVRSTASYWVRVTNACGTADSATALVTPMRSVRRHLRRSN
ncbi:MAG: immunoglobulin domain-containing protein [Acidobacteriia bacterium]|nr:immunoglobulin domain-containing protein [Terriglobia bacterium]